MELPGSVCEKCGGAMEIGFALDKDRNGVERLRWMQGTPEYSAFSNVQTDGECRAIVMHRCTQCGRLELYASETVDPPGWFTS